MRNNFNRDSILDKIENMNLQELEELGALLSEEPEVRVEEQPKLRQEYLGGEATDERDADLSLSEAEEMNPQPKTMEFTKLEKYN